jgi:Ig-like domain from next to BRCA1 gene
MKEHYFKIVSIVIVSAFVLAACGSSASQATPTPTPLSVEAISTFAVQTAFAQLTLEAPTITPTPAFTNTPNVTATPALQKPTATKPAPTAASCSNMKFVSDVTIPDGTQMPVNQTFTKTWRVQNSGTCTWTTSYKLVFSYGEAMSGQTVALASAVPTGQTMDISVNLKVPNKTGKLTGVWTLEDDKGQPFGPTLTVVINVGAVTPTATGGATVAPTQTLTPAPTETAPVPTETPTETSTSTS